MNKLKLYQLLVFSDSLLFMTITFQNQSFTKKLSNVMKACIFIMQSIISSITVWLLLIYWIMYYQFGFWVGAVSDIEARGWVKKRRQSSPNMMCFAFIMKQEYAS